MLSLRSKNHGRKNVVVYTTMGQIVGRLIEIVEEDIKIRKPCMMVPHGTGVQFVPLTYLTTEDTFVISPNILVFFSAHPVVSEIEKKYLELTSDAGIKIVNSLNG